MVFKFKPVQPVANYQSVSEGDWSQWTWQMRQTLTTASDFAEVFNLTPDETEGFKHPSRFKVATTPYYASLARDLGEFHPIRKILMPSGKEAETSATGQRMLDPLAEVHHSPRARIVHRYSDRVLFLVTDTCSVYCRFCTRKRFTGQEEGFANKKDYNEALDYIRAHPGIREVIFSGGDPLTLSNKVLSQALKDVRAIEHVEIIRIGSRMPTVCPMRIDKDLALILREYAPVYMMTHFSHPKELTREAVNALTLLVDHGIPVFNQMVLLNGVNNSPVIVQALSRRLLYLRVKPYYMFQCDPSEGTDHLRTSVESSEEIVRELWGHLSGLAMPTLSLDIPSGGGKTTLVPNFMMKSENGVREFKGWDGRKGIYIKPQAPELIPSDVEDYSKEWNDLKLAKELSKPL